MIQTTLKIKNQPNRRLVVTYVLQLLMNGENVLILFVIIAFQSAIPQKIVQNIRDFALNYFVQYAIFQDMIISDVPSSGVFIESPKNQPIKTKITVSFQKTCKYFAITALQMVTLEMNAPR